MILLLKSQSIYRSCRILHSHRFVGSGDEFGFETDIIPAETQGSALSNTSCLPNEAGQRQTLDQSSNGPPAKKSRNMQSDSTNRRVSEQLLFKTKACSKFQMGSCSNFTNCNFAHSLEEVRIPPPNWQETAAMAHQGVPDGILAEPYMLSGSRKGQLCKRFISNTGCSFGDYCNFLHDEESKERESVVITLKPTSAAPGSEGVGGGGGGDASGTLPRPINWKTRLCKNWEATGTCSYGNVCRFAHGFEDLRGNASGQFPDRYATDPSIAPLNTSTDPAFHYSNVGVPSQGPTNIIPKRLRKAGEKWKGPDKISLIYGDWIEDIE